MEDWEEGHVISSLSDVMAARGWSSERFSRYALPSIMSNIETRLERLLPAGSRFELTSLQRQALNDPRFWGDTRGEKDEGPQHLIIQGATSAGKTLLSELAILDVLCHQGKALVLVPLKAMVRERTEHFKADIERCPHEYRVFGSSSDFMDNDQQLIEGEYEVGVLVYEKLFAMLNQEGCHILERCQLIVVDELSMLSKEDRGPKLEVALEIVRELSPQTRIMCLATSDCGAAHVASWLGEQNDGAEEPPHPCAVIASPARPLGLDEYLVRHNGTYRFRHIAGEQERSIADAGMGATSAPNAPAAFVPARVTKEGEGTIEVPGYNREDRPHQQKAKLLVALLEKVYAEQPGAKVLVFVSGRDRALRVARQIQEKAAPLFPHRTIDPTLAEKLAACDADEDRANMEELIPRGIAYHHAGVSTNLRELIEEGFGAHLKLIVATETLTVGVNLPFDVMIMMDYAVPRGEGDPVPVSNQEYRNYIGRAGRLGQSNRTGTSYLMVNEPYYQDYYWDGLTRTEEITSALAGASVAERAPFYLGLLYGTHDKTGPIRFTASDIDALHERSFSHACSSGAGQGEEIVKELVKAEVCAPVKGGFTAHATKSQSALYYLNDLGRRLAPFALTSETCQRILYYFAQAVPGEGLPVGASLDDLAQDRHLLEMLYRICQHPEVARLSMLRLPAAQARETHAARDLVKRCLVRTLEERNAEERPRHLLWTDEPVDGCLSELLGSTSRIDAGGFKLQCALRAIVLYWWTQGKTVAEIRALTGFGDITKITAGDLERMADVVAYHIEAIYNCLVTADTDQTQILESEPHKEFWTLRTRLRYGMGRDLAILANKHVHGLDRARIINLGEAAARAGMRPVEALFALPDRELERIMTRHQKNELRRRVEGRYTVTRLETLLQVMSDDLGTSFTERQEASIRELAAWNSDVDVAELVGDALAGTPLCLEHHVRHMRGAARWLYSWEIMREGALVATFTLGALPPSLDAREFASVLAASAPETLKIAVAPSYEDLEKLMAAYPGNQKPLLAMDREFFALLLASALTLQPKTQDSAARGGASAALAAFLADAVGIFTAGDQHSFSLFSYLPRPHQDLGHRDAAPSARLLTGHGTRPMLDSAYAGAELRDALEDGARPLRLDLAPWGGGAAGVLGEDEGLPELPVAILLEPGQIQRSRSLMEALYQVVQRENVSPGGALVIFGSEHAKRQWDDAAGAAGAEGGLAWYGQINKLPTCVAKSLDEAAAAVRAHAEQWAHPGYLIGVSYGHYDPTDSDDASRADVTQLERLVSALARRYGRSRVLFDKYHEALFNGMGAQGASLEAYRVCRLYVVLDTIWTERNENCRKEIEVIRDRCAQGEANCLVLQPTAPGHQRGGIFDLDAEQPYVTQLETSPEDFCRLVAQKLASSR